jgi:hypothetical protein
VEALKEKLLKRLSTAAREGRLDGLQIEYWVGGGQPPPFYRSEQFRLLANDDKPQLEFSVLRFHKELKPNEVKEVFSLPAEPEDVRAVAGMLVEKKVFESRFAEETDPRIGSVISYELTGIVDREQEKRVYYRAMPKELAALQSVFEKLIERTKKKGKHSWRHQGRTIEDPFAKVNK